MWKIFVELDLERAFDSISLKLDRMVGNMENLNKLYRFSTKPSELGGGEEDKGHANTRIQ